MLIEQIFELRGLETSGHRRSQDFWLGGAQTLKNSAVFTEIESEFWAEIGNSNDFSAQIQMISKKKKKKVFTKIKSDFSAEIGNSNDFSAQIQMISKKKKKKVFTEIKSDFSAKIGNSNDFSAQIKVISKKKKVFTEIESGFSAETVSFTVTLLFNYCYVRNYWKKLQLNIVRLCCHNFLSLVEFWLGGGRAPWASPWLRLRLWPNTHFYNCCFHDKIVIVIENIRLDCYLLLKYYRRQYTLPPPLLPGPNHVQNLTPKMQDFKHVLDLL